MLDLTISIVSFNTKDLLRKCLKSIFSKIEGVSFEIFVIDNNSQDDSVQMVKKEFPQVNLIANKTNNFYTKANNQSLAKAKGKYFLILNSDTYFLENCLKKMVDYLENNPKVGAIEGLQVYPTGKPVITGTSDPTPLLSFYCLSWFGKTIANKKKVNSYKYSRKDRKETWEAEVICHAFMMARTDLLKKIGGYDENLLLYFTENDLCKRIRNEGYKLVHFGEAKVGHNVNASTQKVSRKEINKIYLQDLLKYYFKWGKKLSGLLLFLDLKIEYWILEHLKRDFR